MRGEREKRSFQALTHRLETFDAQNVKTVEKKIAKVGKCLAMRGEREREDDEKNVPMKIYRLD